MKSFSILAAVLALGLTLTTVDADAKRLGGSKSVGMQRQNTAEKAAAPAPTNNTGTPASAAAPGSPAAAAASTAAAGAASQAKRSWMGPLAGLAAGLGLAALASHFGFGDELASMMMFALIAFAVIALIGFVLRKRAAGGANPSPLATAAAGAGSTRHGYETAAPAAQPMQRAPLNEHAQNGGSMIGSGLAPSAAAGVQRNIPADFDVTAFARNAKVNFIRLQAANDAGNLDDLRQFTTPEMFAELKMDIADRKGTEQHTEVVNVDADVLDVAEENGQYVVSVRFTGHVLEEKHQPAEAFDEVWHMTKPLQGAGGWVIAGIEQLKK
jgi:predicted lipid-binding transport protein (Tim44 family)